MSALVNNIGLSNDNTSVTKISAHARIDYILRFSKQAILVIDESVEQNAALSGQFLASLSEQHNAAYISLSSQFNNIQIRCRIIEQLSAGELFDPEISLAVSVINLAKKSPQVISIILDNAQYLSLQILHETAQLIAIAKKANLNVNIVMFGSAQAGKTVADNKTLFDDKLALLSAQSGQLLSTTALIFKNTQPKWSFIKQNKWWLSVLVLLFCFAVLVISLLQRDSFNFSKSLVIDNQEKILLKNELAKPQTMVLIADSTIAPDAKASSLTEKTQVHSAAVAKDIYLSLTSPVSDRAKENEILPASPADIMLAMATEVDDVLSIDVAAASVSVSEQKTAAKIVANHSPQPLIINNAYYADKKGYVIQIAAFSELKLPKKFLDTLTGVEYKAYQRLLNNKPVVVITSTVYAERPAAELALSQLPKALLERQPWLKSVTVVNNEINAFLSSQ
ncbi:hypothetical protein FGD67_12555 [Colwellia sp. M166]|uniref:SPOR domain-containing protein n=1 Tax=Colwellia sp. M166 TaxID=2583805 RepID=UPI00211E22C3|nr:SPOR domain-containing protein [Colwellia sp. M166]UUO23962.1 hypothetical protein FGD67_12555 [Colwellia sp. M166]|tara:strand:- start:19266 stop:20618 length:1353 start_codon:yes stop_codon:yes gene_type:complete